MSENVPASAAASAANQASSAAPAASAERVALNRRLAQMLKGGVIKDVTTPEQARSAEAIVKATTNFNDPEMLAALSEDLGEAMVGINEQEIQIIMEERGQ